MNNADMERRLIAWKLDMIKGARLLSKYHPNHNNGKHVIRDSSGNIKRYVPPKYEVVSYKDPIR